MLVTLILLYLHILYNTFLILGIFNHLDTQDSQNNVFVKRIHELVKNIENNKQRLESYESQIQQFEDCDTQIRQLKDRVEDLKYKLSKLEGSKDASSSNEERDFEKEIDDFIIAEKEKN